MKKLLIILALVTVPAFADQVIGIADGDTLTVLHDRKPLKIRLANIDAPEKKQAFGERSKQSLSDLCFQKDATYTVQNIDRYGRSVAVVACEEVEVNRAQVERGLAWVYAQYNKDGSLPKVQAEAKSARRGVWTDTNPTPPWEFRHPKNRAERVAANDAECHTGPRGGHYRIVNDRKQYGC
ncbi:thermonuclease family protein [Undibacterium arcticum]|uniref:Thermonuclease family protein n=1 Tax=Undibacterium arcticum TaxID=1762892 RepID=A0ABV7F6X6_9BURK